MNSEVVTSALQVLPTVDPDDIPTNMEELTEVTIKKKNIIESYMQTLPEKLFSLTIRVGMTFMFIMIGLFLIKLLRRMVKRTLEKTAMDKGVIQFVDSCLKVFLYVLLILTVAVNYGFDAASIVAILGSAGIAIGLSLQGALSNFAGGLLILFLKPFKVGDYIVEDTKGNEGIVTEINIFYTHLRTLENKTVVVPNGILASGSLTNASAYKKRQLDMRIGIGYGSDIQMAKATVLRVINENQFILKDEPVNVFVHEIGDSSIVLGLRAWCNTDDYWNARWSINEEIIKIFKSENIEIPFSQVDVHLKED